MLVADQANGRLRQGGGDSAGGLVCVWGLPPAALTGCAVQTDCHPAHICQLQPALPSCPCTSLPSHCRILNLHDPDCYAAAKKALARRYTARSLWGMGIVVALVTALAAAVFIHSRQLTAAGFVVWRRSGEEGGQPADGGYGPLVDAAEQPDTPAPQLPRAQ